MRTLIITLTLLICTLHSYAQTDTLYFDQDWKQTDWDGASNYRVYRLDPTNTTTERLFLTEDHSITRDRLLSTGGYVSQNGLIKNGLFTFYDTSGNETRTETYDHGKKTGTWITYRTPSKDIWYNKKYTNDLLVESTSYYPNGKIVSKETYGQGITTIRSFDTLGNETKVTEAICSPTFDIGAYLNKSIVYPNDARENNIQGRVIVKFVVDTDGTIKDVVIAKSVSKDLDAEAIRVVSNMPRWKPATQNGKPVKVYFTIPISFRLEDDIPAEKKAPHRVDIFYH